MTEYAGLHTGVWTEIHGNGLARPGQEYPHGCAAGIVFYGIGDIPLCHKFSIDKISDGKRQRPDVGAGNLL